MASSLLPGIIPPLISPLTDKLDLDREGLTRLINHVIGGGVNGIFLLGSTGEGSSLDRQIHKQVLDSAVKAVSGRVPLLLNISSTSYLETLYLAEDAANSGVDIVVLAPPFYFPMNQEEISNYFLMIADQSRLPLLLYNAPQYTKIHIEAETVHLLMKHENIIGIKDSSGDMEYVNRLLEVKGRREFKILIGPEIILTSCLQLGCYGGVNGGANLFPRLYVQLYDAVFRENLLEIRRLEDLMKRVHDHIYHVADSPMGIVIGLKFALFIRGICTPSMATPVYGALSDTQKRNIEKFTIEMVDLDF